VSLRRRFVLTFVAFSVLLTTTGGLLAWFVTKDQVERELDEKLVWVAGAAADVGGLDGLAEGLTPGAEGTGLYAVALSRLRLLQNYVSAVYVFRRDQTVAVSTAGPDSLPIGAPLHFLRSHQAALAEAWSTGRSTSELFDVDGRWYKYGFVKLREDDLMMAVLIPADYRAGLDRFRRTLVFGSVLASLLAALVAAFMATRVAGPLDRLSRAALRIQRGRMDDPIEVEGTDELGRLSRAMERMRVGLLERDEHLRLMLAQVAHEIRNPLGGMELLASVASETDDPAERRRLIGRVREEVTALNEIITQFLTFARPTDSARAVHDAREPIRDAAEIVAAEIRPDGKRLEISLPGQALLVDADPDQVKRVMLNLLRNAAQAGHLVKVEGSRHNGEVVIAVRDDGPGVDPELRERVFDPFVTDKEQGAGLGLAIVRKLAEANGGRVELAAPGGSGAEFRVYLQGSGAASAAGTRGPS
jgi:two-component system OmpR family sensor kinase